MGSRLPGTLDVGAPRGERPSTATVRTGDLGLGEVAEQVGRYAETRARVDTELADREAEKTFARASQDFETAQAERVLAYKGEQPGFARDELSALDAHFKPLLDGAADPKVRDGLQKRFDRYKAQVGGQALNIETGRRAQVRDRQERAQENAAVMGGVVAFQTAYAALQKPRVDGYDGSQPGFTAGTLQDFDAAAAQALEATPEANRPALQAKLDALKVSEQARAIEVEDKGSAAFVVRNVKSQGAALANAVLTNPAGFDQAAASLDQVVGGLPAAQRPEVRRALEADLAEARLTGFLADDDTASAKAELEGGRFDRLFSPEVKARLMARVEAAEKAADGPKTVADWARAFDAEHQFNAEVVARATTGRSTGFSLQAITDLFSPREVAAMADKLQTADRTFAAVGGVQTQSSDALRDRAAAPPPDPSEPGYADKREAWELQRKAAAEELKVRESDGAAWAQRSTKPGDGGSYVQERWKAFAQAGTPEAGSRYAGLVLGQQEAAGLPRETWRVLSKDQAAAYVTAYARAPAEKKAEALASLAALVSGMPSVVRTKDGGVVSAQAMVVGELKAARLGSADASAVADLADDRAGLEQYAAAAANPEAVKPLSGKGRDAALEAKVAAALSPYFASTAPIPGAAALASGQTARVTMTARHLVLTGTPIDEAVKAAARDLTAEYQFSDGWRAPKAAGSAGVIRQGAARAMGDLIRLGGDLLSPEGAGAPGEANRRESAADIVAHHGRWVARPDDKGLMLMIPAPGGWTLVKDKNGAPVDLSWSQLSRRATEPAGPANPGDRFTPSWMAPAPSAAAGPARVPPAKAAAAFAGAVERRESGGQAGAVSPKGALGVMQLMPATAQAAAKRLGVAYEPGRLTTDPDYNRRLGREEIRHLSERYGGNVALVAAAYNAGPGAVDGWLKTIGDPRRGRVNVDAWVAAIPYAETRDYVRSVLPEAYRRLQS